jgi:hypothetical protein
MTTDDLARALDDLDDVDRRALIVAAAEARDDALDDRPRLAHVYAVLAAEAAESQDRVRATWRAIEADLAGGTIERPGDGS